jgi:hypothetical protein
LNASPSASSARCAAVFIIASKLFRKKTPRYPTHAFATLRLLRNMHVCTPWPDRFHVAFAFRVSLAKTTLSLFRPFIRDLFCRLRRPDKRLRVKARASGTCAH